MFKFVFALLCIACVARAAFWDSAGSELHGSIAVVGIADELYEPWPYRHKDADFVFNVGVHQNVCDLSGLVKPQVTSVSVYGVEFDGANCTTGRAPLLNCTDCPSLEFQHVRFQNYESDVLIEANGGPSVKLYDTVFYNIYGRGLDTHDLKVLEIQSLFAREILKSGAVSFIHINLGSASWDSYIMRDMDIARTSYAVEVAGMKKADA